MKTEALMSAVDGPLGAVGASWYFVPETLAAGAAHGLGGLRWYLIGRGGVLGDVDAAVVTSAFGYFKHSLVKKLWDSSRLSIEPRVAGSEYFACAADHGRRHLGAVAGLEEFCLAASEVIARADPAGLALFAAIAAEDLSDDVEGRALQLSAVLRELRGSAHLLAVVASGLAPRTAHWLRRPDAFGFFGWSDEEAPLVTDEDRRLLSAADTMTDTILGPAWGALDEDRSDAFLATLDAIRGALGSTH